jgi:feruloyl esterase
MAACRPSRRGRSKRRSAARATPRPAGLSAVPLRHRHHRDWRRYPRPPESWSEPARPPNRSLQQDVDAEAATQAANPQAILSDTASWTNLNTFSGHGGKLIFFHGMSDPWFSANDTIDYYTRMEAASGGAQQVQSWSRLFLSPGMGHCAGGQSLDSFDLLTALVDWVEKGTAPDAVIATGRAFPGAQPALCAYPKSAYYKGSGDTQDAKNFECRP